MSVTIDPAMRLRCTGCGAALDERAPHAACPECGGLLEVVIDDARERGGQLRALFDARWRDRADASPGARSGVWRYRELGLYGRQLDHLYGLVGEDRVLVVRYRDIVDEPAATVDRACRFLGIEQGHVDHIPKDNSRTYVEPGWRPKVLGPVVRSRATS